MQLAKWLIIPSFLLLTACPKEKPQAWQCTFIVKDVLSESYSFCVNVKTKEEKSVPVQQMNKWVTADLESYENFRKWYQEQCK